jgi:hypothetical protein
MPKTSVIVESLTGYAVAAKHVGIQPLKRLKLWGVNFWRRSKKVRMATNR